MEFDVIFCNESSSFGLIPIEQVVSELSSPTAAYSSIFLRLKEAAPPPRDHLGLKLAVTGAAKAAAAACQCIEEVHKTPIEDLRKLCRNLQELALQCHKLFDEKAMADSVTLAKRRLSAAPGWRLLTLIGAQGHVKTGFTAAAGFLLIRALIINKPMPTGLCKSLCTAYLPDEPSLLVAELLQPAEDIESAPLRRLSGNLTELLVLVTQGKFEVRPKDMNQIVHDSWSCRAAFPTINCRSAVLDSRCFSDHQMVVLTQSTSVDIFDSQETRKVAIFLAAFSGMAPIHLPSIPFANTNSSEGDSHIIAIDLQHGVLIKNYGVLCADVSEFNAGSGSIATYILYQPLPGCVYATLSELHKREPNAKTVGELIPRLADISSRQPVFPTTAGFAPSWAKLRMSVAAYLRQNGMDALLAATLTADFGTTLKSKLYYCHITPQEILKAANYAYAKLGFQPCVPGSLQVPFGTNALTPDEELRGVYLRLATQTALAAPANNASVDKLLAHHNNLTLLVGFCVSLACALRESKALPIMSGHAEHACTVAVDEKSPQDIDGHLEALVPTSMRQILARYKAHSGKLAKRLQKKYVITAFTARLHDIQTRANVPLLQLAGKGGSAKALGTADILQACAPTKLAPDFGRKWAENALRRAGMRTTDIDRILRHEGRGQEAMSSAADGSFPSWTIRAGTILERTLMAIFNSVSANEGGTL